MSRSTADIEADIAATRAELAGTVEALAAKLDVADRARAGARRYGPALAASAALALAVLVVVKVRSSKYS